MNYTNFFEIIMKKYFRYINMILVKFLLIKILDKIFQIFFAFKKIYYLC